MKNNFQRWQEDWEIECPVPPEIERNLLHQLETFSFFGKIVELFVPNALQTVVKMIGGEPPPDSSGSGPRGVPPEGNIPDWRQPPPGRRRF